MRIYLAGRIAIEGSGAIVLEGDLPSRQGRVALAMLVAEHLRPVARDELADELWGDSPPDAWERSLSAVISKLRSVLTPVGLPKGALEASHGAYQLNLPPDAWIDLEVAHDGLHDAEARLRAGDAVGAYPGAHAATYIYERPFLPGADGPWVRAKRLEIAAARLRACDAAGEVCCEVGELDIAVSYGERAVALDPFRESGWRLIMRAHALRGSRAEGLRAYERCRTTLAEELGIEPSPETEAVYLSLLGVASKDAAGPDARVLATVLFTDIVGSTERAVHLGDAAWKAVLERHDAAVHAAVGAAGGRIVGLTGDGCLAIFDAPAVAVRCGAAVRAAMAEIELAVRVGVHTGEVEERGDDIGGIGVHIGQRISAAAAAGEVLVSSTVKDLVAGSGLEFVDRGDHELRGVPGTWRLFALDE